MSDRKTSELDPLLPQNSSSPEISGFGYSTSKPPPEIVEPESDHDESDPAASADPSSSSASPLNTLIGIFTLVVAIGLVIATVISRGSVSQEPGKSSPTPPTLSDRVAKILDETPLIDGHNDLAIYLRFAHQNHIHDEPFKRKFEDGGLGFHVDQARLRKGMVGGAFWSAFVPCPKNDTDFSDESYAEAVSMTLSQIDVLHRLQSTYPNLFSSYSLDSASALAAFRTNHTLVSPISIEGLHQIPQTDSLSTLRLYHLLGVRAATLTHNCVNAFADPALSTSASGELIPAPPYWNGLSPRGHAVIRELNRLGILVDLSHTSHKTQLDVLAGHHGTSRAATAPAFYSHSSAFALCPHPRNVRDDALRLVKETNALVMVNFSPDFISCTPSPTEPDSTLPDLFPENNTLHQVARHVVYIGDLIGYDHVGLGSDFDGMLATPRGLDDVSKFPDLVAELLDMGVSDDDVSKVVGRNALRVWGQAEKVAKRLQGELPEGEDDIKGFSPAIQDMIRDHFGGDP